MTLTGHLLKPKAIKIGDFQYPQNIFGLWSNDELKQIGIYPVTIDGTNEKDPEYYTNTSITYAVGSDSVTGSYGTASAKSLTNTLFTAQDETDGLGTEGDVKQEGLKTILK